MSSLKRKADSQDEPLAKVQKLELHPLFGEYRDVMGIISTHLDRKSAFAFSRTCKEARKNFMPRVVKITEFPQKGNVEVINPKTKTNALIKQSDLVVINMDEIKLKELPSGFNSKNVANLILKGGHTNGEEVLKIFPLLVSLELKDVGNTITFDNMGQLKRLVVYSKGCPARGNEAIHLKLNQEMDEVGLYSVIGTKSFLDLTFKVNDNSPRVWKLHGNCPVKGNPPFKAKYDYKTTRDKESEPKRYITI